MPRQSRDQTRDQPPEEEQTPEQRQPARQRGTPSDTPFARVLTAYLWSKTPPWSAGKLAAVLGMNRLRVSKWVYGTTIPELDTMLTVMAQLGIPVAALVDAYAETGIPVPPLQAEDSDLSQQQARAEAERIAAVGPSAASRYPLPGAHRARSAATPPPAQAPAQAPTQAPALEPEPDPEQEWQTMLDHTRQVMRMTGMSDDAINGMLANLSRDRARNRAGQPSPHAQRIAEELEERDETRQPEQRPSGHPGHPGHQRPGGPASSPKGSATAR